MIFRFILKARAALGFDVSDVVHPGSHGGKFYFTRAGRVRYAAKRQPVPKPPEQPEHGRVILFRSGASDPTPIRGYRQAGVPIGVEIGNVSDNAAGLLASYVIEGGHVFVDSGAFPAFRRGEPMTSADFDRVLDRYQGLLDRVTGYGPIRINPAAQAGFLRRFHLVMPDIIGDQAGSFTHLEHYADRVRHFIAQGATVLVPIQKGALSLADAYRRIVGILGTASFTVSIPSNEAAVSRDELLEFVRDVKPLRIHLLGIGRPAVLEELRKTIQVAAPATVITADANRIRAMVGKGRKLTTAVNTAAEYHARRLAHEAAEHGLEGVKLLREIRPTIRVGELARIEGAA